MTATVLVVDDETLIAGDLRSALLKLGYDLAEPVAKTSQAAGLAERVRPELVVVDARKERAGGASRETSDAMSASAEIRARLRIPVVHLDATSPIDERGLRAAIERSRGDLDIEARSRARERWVHAALQAIGDGVLATDAAGKVTFISPVAETLVGCRSADALGRSIHEVVDLRDPSGARADPMATVPARGQHLLVRKSGERLSVEQTTCPIVDDEDRVVGAIVAFRDVTERRRLEQRLAQSERLASIGTMAAGMAHEINNPLAYVITNIGLAVEGLLASIAQLAKQNASNQVAQLRELVDALREADEGANRVRRIVHDLKKFSRVEDSSLSVIDLPDVLDASVKITASAVRHHARIRKQYGATPLVEANEGQLTQVFTNILTNAVQALGDGQAEHHEIVISTRTDAAGRGVVEVHDSGTGIPAEILPRIFDPFFTSKPAGSGIGLGLTICQNIIGSLGGEITAESSRDKGTTVRVALLPTRTSSMRTRAVQPPPGTARRGKVLVIDDELAVARSIARMLRTQHDVVVEPEPRRALTKLLEGEIYDVIFCDLMMPSMSGIDLYRGLAVAAPEQAKRMVFMTGGAFSPRSQAFLENVGNVSLAKPFTIQAIRAIVDDYVK